MKRVVEGVIWDNKFLKKILNKNCFFFLIFYMQMEIIKPIRGHFDGGDGRRFWVNPDGKGKHNGFIVFKDGKVSYLTFDEYTADILIHPTVKRYGKHIPDLKLYIDSFKKFKISKYSDYIKEDPKNLSFKFLIFISPFGQTKKFPEFKLEKDDPIKNLIKKSEKIIIIFRHPVSFTGKLSYDVKKIDKKKIFAGKHQNDILAIKLYFKDFESFSGPKQNLGLLKNFILGKMSKVIYFKESWIAYKYIKSLTASFFDELGLDYYKPIKFKDSTKDEQSDFFLIFFNGSKSDEKEYVDFKFLDAQKGDIKTRLKRAKTIVLLCFFEDLYTLPFKKYDHFDKKNPIGHMKEKFIKYFPELSYKKLYAFSTGIHDKDYAVDMYFDDQLKHNKKTEIY